MLDRRRRTARMWPRKALVFAALLAVLATAGDWSPVSAQRQAPAYDADLLRFAEILGAIHYLRDLCGAGEGQLWRDKMNELIEAENPDQQQRRRLVAHFNHGYRSFSEIHRSCTPAASRVANRYQEEGARLAEKLLENPDS